jgi:uncharacterized protein YjiS (DUF1127 family)
MLTLITWPARRVTRSHQKSWGLWLRQELRRWHPQWARHRQRKALRDLADDPHLLADIGVTREQALEEAGKSLFEMTDAYAYSSL